MRMFHWTMLSVFGILPCLSGLGCPTTTTVTLTDAEKSAIDSAIEAAGALSQATAGSQTPAHDDAAGQPSGSVTVGTCPAVTTSLDVDAEDGTAATLNLNFGTTPCSPEAMPGLVCSGTASGSINVTSRSVVLNFDQLSCGADVLSGSVEATFAFSEVGVVLVGSFNLDWTSGTDNITAVGQGEYGYNRSAHASTIAQFTGSISDPAGTYTTSLTDVLVSYQNNGNLIPSDGVLVLSGPTIRQLTIRCNADSPTTGEVEVSVNGSSFITVNVFQL